LGAAGVLLPVDAADWGRAAVLVRTQTHRGRVMRLTNLRHGAGGQLVLLQDITLEAALERQATQLNAALQQAQARLVERETLASLGGLVAGVAHEINTPIGIGVTAITHLAQDLAGLGAAFAAGQLKRSALAAFLTEAEEAVGLVQANLERAAALVTSFKMVSADQTSQELRDYVLGDYLRDVVNSLGPRLKQTGVGVALDCPPGLVMYGAPGALAQVVTNFITNALTHAFAPGAPGSIVIAVRHEGERVRLRVADNGRGMSAQECQAAFRPFFTTRRHAGGTGLGLSIVHQLVTGVLRGRIELTSAPGQGTTFLIDLPLDFEATDPS
jgi:signal transduction histidine kinase